MTPADEAKTAALKKELRARCRAKRAAFSPAALREADRAIFKRIRALTAYRESGLLLCYMSMPGEPDTRAVIDDALARRKTVAAPRCDTAACTMRFCELGPAQEFTKGSYGIPEPCGPCVDATHGLLLVPGLCFDTQGYRLGHGKGYYDRFLPGFAGVAVGLCYDELLCGSPLPRDSYDCAVDILVTQTKTLCLKHGKPACT